MRAALMLPILLAAQPAAAAPTWLCRFTGAGEALELRLGADGGGWRLQIEGESYEAAPVAVGDSPTRHFLIAPVDRAADAVALVSIFADGKAFLSLHGDFFGGSGATRDGTCQVEGG